jgi:peptidoglycan hydrolase CwlO-like protein
MIKESLLTIVTSLSELEKFSHNLEGKVDTILQAQESQFVDSYKNHVSRIKKEFEMMNKHVEELQEKIRYY